MTAAELSPEAAAWLEAARAAKAEIRRLEEITERAISHVQAELGDADEATVNGRPVLTWAWSKPGQRLDRAALEADLGADVVAKYLRDNKPARPFKILDPGDGE